MAELNSINKIVSEVVWNDRNGWATGGVSSFFAKPSYQKKLALVKRGVPDVCGDAADTGYIIHMNGADYVVGGTSAVAALIALINQTRGKNVGSIHSAQSVVTSPLETTMGTPPRRAGDLPVVRLS